MSDSGKHSGPFFMIFEYILGSHKGGRFIIAYPTQEAADEARQRNDADPDSRTKIVSVCETMEEAQGLCDEAMTDELIDSILADTPEELREMEAMKFAMVRAIRGGS